MRIHNYPKTRREVDPPDMATEAELDRMIAEQRPTMPPKIKSDFDSQAELGLYIAETVLRGRGMKSAPRKSNW